MSNIKKAVDDYLKQRRALGYELRLAGRALYRFTEYLERHNAEFITIDLAVKWAKHPLDAQQATWSRKLSMVRGFAKYHYSFDHRTEVPPVNLIPLVYQRPKPYIYTTREIEDLMDTAMGLPSEKGLRSQTYYALLGLLSVTGLRIKEAILLKNEDIDLDSKLITVKKGKLGKYRLVPIRLSSVHALRNYVSFRNKIYPRSQSDHFFISESGRELVESTVNNTFRKICANIDLQHVHGHAKPRLHDLRHTFAVNTLIAWHKKGENVQQKLPSLSTFLGHAHTTDTYWYLTAVPELFGIVSERLKKLKIL
jgi:integrase